MKLIVNSGHNHNPPFNKIKVLTEFSGAIETGSDMPFDGLRQRAQGQESGYVI